jgi:hypothetical protein
MDEIVPGLWLGDLPSAANTQLLKSHNICAIVSVMRGSLTNRKVGGQDIEGIVELTRNKGNVYKVPDINR